MVRVLRVFWLVCAGTSVSSACVAQLPHRLELTPVVGFRWGGNFADAITPPGVAYDLHLRRGGNIGLILDRATRVQGLWLEASWAHEFASLDAEEQVMGARDPLGDLAVDHFHLGALYDLPSPGPHGGSTPVAPFVGLTLGGTRFAPAGGGLGEEWRASAGIVLGVKTFVAERIGFRMQSRIMTTYLNSDSQLFCSPAGPCYQTKSSSLMSQVDLTAGIIFNFSAGDTR